MATSAECRIEMGPKQAHGVAADGGQVGTVCWRFGCPFHRPVLTLAIRLPKSSGEPVPSESARFEVMLVYMV